MASAALPGSRGPSASATQRASSMAANGLPSAAPTMRSTRSSGSAIGAARDTRRAHSPSAQRLQIDALHDPPT